MRLRSTIKQRNKFGDIVGRSDAMQEIYELMLMAAASEANIILYDQNPARLAIVMNHKRKASKSVRQSLAGVQLFVFGVIACCC